jgi:hypothetical protein
MMTAMTLMMLQFYHVGFLHDAQEPLRNKILIFFKVSKHF